MADGAPDEAASGSSAARAPTTIDFLADVGFLKSVWKSHVRKALRSNTLNGFYLAQDPVQFAAYEWGLEPFLARLAEDLRTASYSPDPADIIRGAKATGLSRPLAFLSPRDALLYRAVILRAEPDIHRDARPWAGAFQKDKAGEEPPENIDYADWFALWLAKQGVIATICERCEFVVESDISNFFDAVDLDVVREYLLQTSLHRDVVRLCVHLIKRVMRHPEYAESPTMGLPQENLDCSRTIAHGLLSEVDAAFDLEGGDGVYARFMDDFAVGAGDTDVGEQLIARLQRRLERLGLHPNRAKTRVVPVPQYLAESMADENAFLDRIDAELKAAEEGELRAVDALSAEVRIEVLERAAAFRKLEQRPRRWDRVLRRYYTVFRRLGVDSWLEHVQSDLREYPDGVRNFLEYVRAFPLTRPRASEMWESCDRLSVKYEDVPLLQLETIATSPVGDDVEVWRLVGDDAMDFARLVRDQVKAPRDLADWMLAASIPAIGKFASAENQQAIMDELIPTLPVQSVARLQAFPLQLSLGQQSSALFQAELAGLPWGSVMATDFIRGIEAGDERAIGVALGLLQPAIRLLPNRYQLHARPLLLIGLLRRLDEPRVTPVLGRAGSTLAKNPERLRDYRTIHLLGVGQPSAEE